MSIKPTVIKIYYLLMMLFLSATSNAQQIKGTIVGNGSFLPGASVSVVGKKQQTFTDINGNFSLVIADQSKSVKLNITYIGFDTYSKEVALSGNSVELGELMLTESKSNLGNIIVSGTLAGSIAKAYSIKRTSLAIMDVLAADAIGKLPDRNAAEAVQRMQGVAVARYHGEADQATVRGTPFAWTSTLFNGSRLPAAGVYGTRASILDAVPSEMIQYVQVAKAITPDMEGDAIGGAINFITRTAPVKRTLNISAAGGYNNFSKDGTFNGSIAWGDRFFNGKLGVFVSAAIWDRNWGTDSYDVTYNTGLASAVQKNSINTVQYKRYMGKRQTYGSNLGMEWKFNSSNRIYARALLDKFNDIRPVYEHLVDFSNIRYQYNYRFSEYQTGLNGFELGGEHQLSKKLSMNWQASNYNSSFLIETPNTTPENQRGLPIAQFRQRITGGLNGLASDGKKYWYFDSPDKTGDDPMNLNIGLKNPGDQLDASRLLLSQLVIAQLDNTEQDNVGQVNFKWDANPKFKLKAGLKLRNKVRDGINFATLVWLPNASLGIPNSPALVVMNSLKRAEFPLRGGYFKELGGDQSKLYIDPLSKQQLFDLYSEQFRTANGIGNYSPITNAATKYYGTESVLAGYVMGEYNASDKLTLVGGLRNESTTITMNSSKIETVRINGVTTNTTTAVQKTSQYNALLPMVHVKFNASEQTIFRAAYTRTFARANFPDLIPNETTNFTTNPATITKGNPDLQPTFSSNFDLMGEHYFKGLGLISGGLFYKKIKNTIFTDRRFEIINSVNTLVAQPKNLDDAFLVGAEIGINKRFDFLNGFWSGFGVDVNYTNIYSEAFVPRLNGTEIIKDKTSLPNQSRNIYNAILFYERNGVMIRLAGNYRGKSVETINQLLGPNFYIWTDKNFTLDLSSTITISKSVKWFVELNNLTNEPLKTYMGDKRRVTMVEWYSQRGQTGIRWDIIK
jgi:TonB-dependent receptor